MTFLHGDVPGERRPTEKSFVDEVAVINVRLTAEKDASLVELPQ